VKQAEAAQTELKGSIEKLTAARATADAATKESDARIADLRGQLAKAEAATGRLKDQAAQAETARQQAAGFAAEVARRLRSAPNTPTADLLAALDRELSRPAGESVAATVARPPAHPARPAP